MSSSDNANADAAPNIVRLGPLVIDLAARKVTVAGERVELPRLQFDLLALLAQHVDHVFTRAELLSLVWQSRPEWQSSATVTEHVRRLRASVLSRPGLPVRLRGVRGVGYVLESLGADASSAPFTMQGLTHSSLVVDGDVVLEASAAAVELLGADDVEELVGHNVLEFTAARSLPAAQMRLKCRADHELLPPERMWVRRIDGREVLVEVSTGAIERGGRMLHRTDMWPVEISNTAQVRALLLGIATEVEDAVVVLDPDWRVESVNAAAEEMYGWREDELIGSYVADVLPMAGADDVGSINRELLRGGHWHGDVEQARRDGSAVQARVSATSMGEELGHPAGIVLVCRPVRGSRFDEDSDGPDVAGDVIRGLDSGEFMPYYQQIVNLESQRVVGVEALARWQHPEHGVVDPAWFLAAMEHSGQVVRLGTQMLTKSALDVASWRARGVTVDLAVNVSSQQLLDSEFVANVAEVLALSGLDAGQLLVELTETDLIVDVAAAADTLGQLAATGVRVAIDDFGTGWASLTYLKRFPIHVLKIDRMFTSGVVDRAGDIAIARSIIALGAELDLVVIAEGVETAEQEAALLELGCCFAQGYRYSWPEPADLAVDRLTPLGFHL